MSLFFFFFAIPPHRTRPGVPVVHVDGQNGPPDDVRRRVRGRDTHGRRRVRISRGPRTRRLFPEWRFTSAARVQFPRPIQDQPGQQIP